MAFVRRVMKLVKGSCLGQKEDTEVEAVVNQPMPLEEGEFAVSLYGLDVSEDSISGDGDVSIDSRSPEALPDYVVIPPRKDVAVTISEKTTLKNSIIIWLRRRAARGRVAPHPTELK